MQIDFAAYPAVLLDLDGTLFHDARPLPIRLRDGVARLFSPYL